MEHGVMKIHPALTAPVSLTALLFALAPAVRAQTTEPKPVPPPTTKPAEPEPEARPDPAFVVMTTSMGEITLELDRARAPRSVENFLSYVNKEYYDGTIFHRVMSNFMIQGGGFDRDFKKKKTDPPVVNEWRNGVQNKRGTIAMARLGGRPDSATSQFFINVKDNPLLDRPQPDGAAYAVFGRVIAGMDVVEAIRTTPVKPSRLNPRERAEPEIPVIIEMVRPITADEAQKRINKEKVEKKSE
jgi:peptidyl-prolyl cis-trans isomerase A (cyclophilin A)